MIGGTRQGLGAIQRLARWNSPLPQVRAVDDLRRHPNWPPRDAPSTSTTPRRILADMRPAGYARDLGDVARSGDQRRCDDRLSGGAESRFRRHPAQIRARPGGRRPCATSARSPRPSSEMQRRVAALGRPIAGYLVQEMVTDGVEVFAGVARDPDFGLSLAFGMGGVGVEILRDFALRPVPLREGDAEAMISETRGAVLLGRIPRTRSRRHRRRLRNVSTRCRILRPPIATGSTRSTSIRSRRGRKGCVIVDALIVTRQR